jgi:Flp pilus assembly protein TadD
VPNGYAADLAAVRRQLAEHEATAEPAGPTDACELLTLRHREIGLSGARPTQLLTLGAEIDAAIRRFPAWPDLRLLRATVALAVHRPDVARAALAALPELADVPPGRVLTADLAVFDGDYGSARKGYLAAAEEDPLWDTTARLAALTLATGEPVEADRLYAAAEDEITVKQLRSFAWVRVQRAELARAVGNPATAERYLADAERAYPGWWYVLAHRAALELAEGNPEVAADSYRHVLADVDRPEFREALGTALAAAGEAAQGAGWHHCALAEYRASADRGEVHYLHHLAAYYADVEPDPQAAVAAARADVAVRRNGATLSLLAWCLHRAGREDEARQAVDEAFALGAGDPLLVSRAREIRRTTRGR